MEVDWFTVIAQMLNFFVLVWLLKKFLYKPVLNAVDAREKKIAEQLADAANKEAEALKERDLFQQKNEEFEQHRMDAWKHVLEETKAERQKQLNTLREEQANLKAELENGLKREQEQAHTAIRAKIQQEVLNITQKVLTDLSTASLEQQIVASFVQRLTNLDTAERDRLNATMKTTKQHSIRIVSGFGLTPGQRAILEKTLAEITGGKAMFDYHQDPALISGLEISINNYQLSWNISHYLDDLDKQLSLSLKASSKEEDVNI